MLKILYNIVIQIRNWLYDYKIFNSYKSSIPIISVGNITLGGTGKTPFVIYLAKIFLNKNLNPLIISRGYKRKSTDQILFKNGSLSPDLVGDEPFLISKKLPEIDIIVNKNRVQAVKYAEKSNKKYDIIILDDAFQHRSIYRDLDIVLINTNQNHSLLLPSGTLREPFKNISRSDCIVLTKNNENFNPLSLESFNIPIFQCEESYSLSNNNNNDGIGFCGIGSPSSFWKTLNDLSINIIKKIEFKDHQKYNAQTIRSIENMLINEKTFFTTEKDWVKLPDSFIKKYNGVFVDMRVEIKNELFLNMLEKLCPKN